MLVFFGTKKFKFKKGETRNKKHCEVCGNDSKWHLIDLWTWAEFMFVPLFPILKKKFFICPMCEYGFKVDRKNRNEITSEIELDR